LGSCRVSSTNAFNDSRDVPTVIKASLGIGCHHVGKLKQLPNSELTESAREHRERELLERIVARDREAMREFTYRIIIV
jgi:hypothetical protein